MQPNRLVLVTGVKAVLRWWPFILEGYKSIGVKGGLKMTPEGYLKIVMHICSLSPKKGRLAILVSGSGEPYGYVLALDITHKFSPKTVNLFAFYTNKKCPSTLLELSKDTEAWARECGYEVVQACSTRFGGGAIRWFHKNMGFNDKMIVFSRHL